MVGFVLASSFGASVARALPGSSPIPTTAAPDASTAAARARFREGAEAYAARRYMEAIQLFLDANRLSPNPAFAYNIGLSYEELGDPSNALRWYREYLRALPEAPDRSEIEGRIVQAERALAARGVQQVTILSSPEGATVALDDRRVGVTPWSGELPPGEHRVQLELRGYSEVADRFVLAADHAVDVPFELHEGTERSAAASTATPPESDAGRTKPVVSPVTWTAFGVGALGLTTALGFQVASSSAIDSARDAPNSIEGKARYDRGGSYQSVALVSVGIGAAFVTAGGALLYLDLTAHPGAPSSRASASRAPVSRTSAGVGCRGALCGAMVNGEF